MPLPVAGTLPRCPTFYRAHLLAFASWGVPQMHLLELHFFVFLLARLQAPRHSATDEGL